MGRKPHDSERLSQNFLVVIRALPSHGVLRPRGLMWKQYGSDIAVLELQLRNLCQKALNIVAVGQLGSASIAAQSCSVCHARAKFSLTFGKMGALVLDHSTLLNQGKNFLWARFVVSGDSISLLDTEGEGSGFYRQTSSLCLSRNMHKVSRALPHTAEESQIRFHYSFVNKLLCVVGELPRIYELNLERKREDIAEANNVVLKTAEERVLEDSPVRKSGNHEPLSSVFGTSPDPAID
ncbi:hypothetical protein QUC31_000348, partial [Theobroma cacao]